ncbi:hypothetical protein MMC26_007109 [Xylographa opegraphella]|nr:hypothetical protein [Xylographa opegraphella]
MAPDYTKHKNAELEQLLRARSLPHTGKKADLIARLVQDDSEKAQHAPAPAAAAPSSAPDDEIGWDDDPAAKAPPTPAATTTTATTETPVPAPLPSGAGTGRAANPLAVPNQVPAIDPSATHDLTVTQPAPAAPSASSPTASTPALTYTPPPPSTLPPLSVESELAKRLARARKYNLPAEVVFEAEKALERFKKFGTVADGAQQGGGLEGALPERAKGKRGRAEEGEGGEKEKGRGAKRVDSRRREGRGRSRDPDGGKLGGDKVAEKDRLAAEARKARFGATA